MVAGLAAQEALGSVVSGVMILAFKPFKMGDVVRYVDNDITGCVEEITLHHTAGPHVREQARYHPKQQGEQCYHRERRLCGQQGLRVPDSGDYLRKRPQKAKELLAREVRKQPAFLDIRTEQQKKDGVPDVPVVVLELADSAVVLRASLWAKDNATAFALKCAVLEGIKLTYDAEGIDIAYPHMQVVKSEK